MRLARALRLCIAAQREQSRGVGFVGFVGFGVLVLGCWFWFCWFWGVGFGFVGFGVWVLVLLVLVVCFGFGLLVVFLGGVGCVGFVGFGLVGVRPIPSTALPRDQSCQRSHRINLVACESALTLSTSRRTLTFSSYKQTQCPCCMHLRV